MKHLFLGIFLFVNAFAFAQNDAAVQKKQAVQVTNWSARTTTLANNFWNKEIETQLLKQMTKADFEYMKQHVQSSQMPEGFEVAASEAQFTSKEDLSKQYLNRLRIYQVATFNNVQNGQNLGKMAVIYVPQSENQNWRGITWNGDVYLLVKADAVKTK